MKISYAPALAPLPAAADCSPHQSPLLQSKQAASGNWALLYGRWIFAFITSRELSSVVNHARVIDTDGHLHTFNTLDQVSPDPDSVREWVENAHGFDGQLNKVKKPPQYIVFCWDSHIDQQTYGTSAALGPETWQRMKTPADHTRPSGVPVWYSGMAFGLSPGGKAKIQFFDVAGRPSLPVTPLKPTVRPGKDLTLCKGYAVPGGSFTFLPSTQAFINGKAYPYGDWNQEGWKCANY